MFAVFGDGHDFDWALTVEEGVDLDDDEEVVKKDLRLEDVRFSAHQLNQDYRAHQ